VAQQNTPRRGWQQSIRPALIISLIMGVVAAVVVSVASVGGTRNGLNFQLGGIAFLIAFVVGLLVISLLMMVVKENPSELGRGSGIHRSSERDDAELEALEAAERGEAVPAPAAEAAPDAAGDASQPQAGEAPEEGAQDASAEDAPAAAGEPGEAGSSAGEEQAKA
jgi:hypothetical protein